MTGKHSDNAERLPRKFVAIVYADVDRYLAGLRKAGMPE